MAIVRASWLAATCLAGLLVAVAWPDEPRAAEQLDPKVRQQVAHALESLDAEDFVQRNEAFQQLVALGSKPELGALLAAEFNRVLLAPQASTEVRTRLQELLKRLPHAAPAVIATSPVEVDRAIQQLDDDTYRVRLAAGRRLALLVDNPEIAGRVMTRLKQRLADPGLAPEFRQQLEAQWRRARGAWLTGDPTQWQLPTVTDEQIVGWLDTLVQPETDHRTQINQAAAQRELVDLLARDEYLPRVEALLSRYLAKPQDSAAERRLKEVAEWLAPAMVAEVWKGGQIVTVQHLLIGVPQHPDRAQGITHFDRIDDHDAHCVSGNTLSEGNYPVGVAIPHPVGQEMMFHLVNLPTPRRRLAYEYEVDRDEAQRLRAISQRTVDEILRSRRHLDEISIMMLEQLDPHVVSRFVGLYFKTVPDRAFSMTSPVLTGQPTEYSALCSVLARIGTHEAVAVLEALARGTPQAEPTPESPLRIAWVAALAIARRDDWSGAEDWIAGLVDNDTPLIANMESAPELGASAAAVLLERHHVSPGPMYLEAVDDATIERLRFTAYRFNSQEGRRAVMRWWNEQKVKVTRPDAG